MAQSSCSREQASEQLVPLETASAPRFDGDLYRFELDLTLGVDEGEPTWQIFGRFIYPAVGDDGRIYILNIPDNIILAISPEGELLRRFGGKGAGPGEFVMPTAMLIINEKAELWVVDNRLTRITRFTLDGYLIDTFSYAESYSDWDELIHITDDRFLGREYYHPAREEEEELDQLVFLNGQLEVLQRFVSIQGERTYKVAEGSWMPLPFSTTDKVRSRGGRIFIGSPDSERIDIYSTDGEPVFSFRHNWDNVKVSGETKRAWLENRRSLNPGMINPEYLNNVALPDEKPAFNMIQIDMNDCIWVRRSPSDDAAVPSHPIFDVFNIQGVWLGTQAMDFSPYIFDKVYAYDIDTSQEHGPRFHRYRMIPLHEDY